MKTLTLEVKSTGEIVATYNMVTLEMGESLDKVTIKLQNGHEVSLVNLLKELGEL